VTVVKQRQQSRARFVTYALLLLITYGSTFEAAHKHGNGPLNAITAQSSVADLGNGKSPAGRSVPGTECLLCQFHQQLSTSVTSNPQLLSAPVSQGTATARSILSYASASHTPRRGRAPPITS
jgi:DUF2946 family protein